MVAFISFWGLCMVNDFWAKDVLGRKENAAYLQQYLTQRYLARISEDGFVLAINAEWGLGKTFMLRCWQEELIHSGYAAVYFDAWKNDFTPEPLVAFISEIDEGFSPAFKNIPRAKKIFREAIKSFKLALKPAMKAAAMGLAKHGLGLSPIMSLRWLRRLLGIVQLLQAEN
ncbi:P-loop NTPase fold protein [Janthinobacterium lividum]|uniref:P-loop NTPase fold protein n=1 Tax=Janthinobacterium lividum TaxID=29581 RepID=UPI0009B88E30|nr:P-loop NTPase fold protein [Janthinobacterium lividum]